MWVLMGTVFVASLLGSLHCVGMCGPFALLASVDKERRNAAALPTIAYSLGRLVTYSVIGVVFGFLGLALNRSTSFGSWQQTATYVAGGLMILVGLVSLVRHLGFKVSLPSLFKPMQKWLQLGFSKTTQMKPIPRAVTIGALTSLMPCGWLYTFAITAAGTGSPWWGGLLMVTFWAGTVPIMTALMMGAQKIGSGLRKQLPLAMATLVVFLGIFTLAFRAPILVGADSSVVSGVEDLTEQVQNVEHSDLPCCQSGE